MKDAIKIGAGVAGGYLLGRTKKLKLAFKLATWVVSRETGLPPDELVAELSDTAKSAGAKVKARAGKAAGSSKSATGARKAAGGAGDGDGSVSSLTDRIEGLADRLHERNESRRQTADAAG